MHVSHSLQHAAIFVQGSQPPTWFCTHSAMQACMIQGSVGPCRRLWQQTDVTSASVGRACMGPPRGSNQQVGDQCPIVRLLQRADTLCESTVCRNVIRSMVSPLLLVKLKRFWREPTFKSNGTASTAGRTASQKERQTDTRTRGQQRLPAQHMQHPC
jgi:hypothetical protein